ncbi:MAG: hypothetical protein IT320_12550 [Anaerolineae bacterium]|nr:hypothetical protein [Anaerolineae bacterium]
MTIQFNTGSYLLWIVAFVGFPIGGTLAHLLLGPVDSVLKGALAGLVTGAVIGLAEWLVLRQIAPLDARWIVATALGMAIGLAAGIGLAGIETAVAPLLIRGAITGLAIGIAQGWLLRDLAPLAGLWIVVLAAAWPLAWTVTRAIGVDMTQQWSVFGSSGAIVFQIVTAVALRLLLG